MTIKLLDQDSSRVGDLLDIIPISKYEYLFIIDDLENKKVINIPVTLGETFYQDKLIKMFYPEAFY